MKRLLPALILALVLGTACAGDPLKAGGITATELDETTTTTAPYVTTTTRRPPQTSIDWNRDIGGGRTLGDYADEYAPTPSRDYAAEEQERRLDRLERDARSREMRDTHCRLSIDKRERDIWC